MTTFLSAVCAVLLRWGSIWTCLIPLAVSWAGSKACSSVGSAGRSSFFDVFGMRDILRGGGQNWAVRCVLNLPLFCNAQ